MKTGKQLLLILAMIAVTSISLGTLSVAPERAGHIYDLVEPQELTTVSQQAHELQVLKDAQQGDTCIFELAGIGGEVHTLWVLVDAVHTTKCFVIMHVRGNVYSAHADLAISGDVLIADRGTLLMFHDVQIGNGGVDSVSAKLYRASFQQNFRKGWGAFLKDSEVKFIFTNSLNELYITGEVMMDRMSVLHQDNPKEHSTAISYMRLGDGGWSALVYIPHGSVLAPTKAIP